MSCAGHRPQIRRYIEATSPYHERDGHVVASVVEQTVLGERCHSCEQPWDTHDQDVLTIILANAPRGFAPRWLYELQPPRPERPINEPLIDDLCQAYDRGDFD